jgi:hypothetical protein
VRPGPGATLGAAGCIALALAAAATADTPNVKLTPAGNAAAQAAVLQRSDLGSGSGWTGSPKQPNLSASFPCASYQPRQSDLVVVGAAETTWTNPPLTLDSEAQVMQTPAMVGLDWKRTVVAAPVFACVRSSLVKQVASIGKLVSFSIVPFPKVAPYERVFRGKVIATSGGTSVPIMVDLVLVGRGRTEIALTSIAPFASVKSMSAAEVRLARLLVGRIRA